MNEFIQVFGQRYVGLIDNIGVYNTYRVPSPEAPYPQDYILDQQGIVRYWSDEYDPQKIIKIIDQLLGSSIKEEESKNIPRGKLELKIKPNPARQKFMIEASGFSSRGATIKIYNSIGQIVHITKMKQRGSAWYDLGLPSGVYYIRLESDQISYTRSLILTE